MKKSTALLAASAVTSLMGMLPPEVAQATACTIGTASTPVTCAITAGGYLATALNFTGSNGVDIEYENAAGGFGACAAHIGGSQTYGLTTAGGSMEVVTGATDLTSVSSANTGSGGC